MRHALALVSALALASTAVAFQAAPAQSTEAISLGLRGVYFVENQGQWSDAGVYYGFKTRGLDIAFRESSFTMHLAREVDSTSRACEEAGLGGPTSRAREEAVLDEHRATALLSGDASAMRDTDIAAEAYEHLTLSVTFPGSNAALPEAAEPQSARFNYYIGDDESKWASNVPSFGEVVYRNLYDGVDLHISGAPDASGVLKYEFHVQPGADYSQIRINYDGIDSLCIDDAGDLHINTTFGSLTDAAPLVWQEDGGTAVPAVDRDEVGSAPSNGRDAFSTDPIPARFELVDESTYRIALDGPVDPTRELIIDPDVEWMRFLGGSSSDRGQGISTDSSGNVLMVGDTNSSDFEGQVNSFFGGERDVFVAKQSSSRDLQWVTYFGGSGSDSAWRVRVNAAGNALVVGWTNSADLSGSNNSYQGGEEDAFLASLDSSGTIVASTYLGGSRGIDRAYSVVPLPGGEVYVSGRTDSMDFFGRRNTHHGGGSDAFVVRLSSNLQVEWMSYLGGSSYEFSGSMAVESEGNIIIVGETESLDFIGHQNAHHGGRYDVFACKMAPSGAIPWMIYLGGEYLDFAHDIMIDCRGDMVIVGETESFAFEGRINSFGGNIGDGYVLKLSPSGQLYWMQYVGGSGLDTLRVVACTERGSMIMAGSTSTTAFRGRTNSYHGGFLDALCMEMTSDGEWLWMTYLGGSGDDRGNGLGLLSGGDVVVSGYTDSTDFEHASNTYHGGEEDAYVLRLNVVDGPELSVVAQCPSGGPIRAEWTGATPSAPAALLFARSTGSFTIPNNRPCAGTTLGLGTQQIRNVFTGNSDANGSRTLNANAGPGACGGYLQLIDLATCATSNVARIE